MLTRWEPPGTLKAAWVITLVGAILGSIAGCLGGVLALSLGSADPPAAGWLVALLVGLFVVIAAVGWVNVWLAARARDGSSGHRWALVILCWLGLASDVVGLVTSPSSAGGLLLNIAVCIALLALLQFSSDTNTYFRRVRAELDEAVATPRVRPGLGADPRPLPGTED